MEASVKSALATLVAKSPVPQQPFVIDVHWEKTARLRKGARYGQIAVAAFTESISTKSRQFLL
jgi:hypothetical protein